MAWEISRTGETTVTLPSSFNLQSYNLRRTYVENQIDGGGTIIDLESRGTPAERLRLRGFIKGTDAADADTQLSAIKNITDQSTNNLVLTNTVTSETFDVLLLELNPTRRGAALLDTTIVFLTDFETR